ncbi:DNA recombination protein RmuC [Erythrobacter sp. YT30]|uniref:DNA recombination protein RmuC n=1 Tax=Erythrobacter sp. YT30 TaxID=1735012 RepID=UPI00076C4F17|nr:DNA recombination protein RmuC [Erythrobacter sp. YT30]KWV90461.1 DNA recombinase [Erythrobacter sp. YT30]
MDNSFLLIITLIAGLVFGGGAAWFFASRPVADLRARLDAREEEFKRAAAELGHAQIELASAKERAARADGLAEQLEMAREERTQLAEKLVAVESQAEERAKAFAEQKRVLIEAREELLNQFKATGAEVLQKNQEDFLRRAEERFKQSEETGEAKIKALLNPVGERLQKYEKQVETLEKQRADAFSSLNREIQLMRHSQEEVRKEAQRLGNSLTNAPKARGRWGEQQLKNLLEQVGLAQHTDFELETSIDTEDGRLRPDAIVRIPGGKVLVIDAKVSLNAYQAAFEADEDEARDTALSDHVRSMRNHVQQLGAKSYQSQFEEAPDYVVMFVPGEHFVAAALEADPTLWDFAFERRVLLATPTNLVAIARTVAQVWRQDGLAKEAQEIGRMGAELYDRLATAAEHLKRVGGGLESAVNNYNKFVGSFERNVLSSGKRLAEKGVEIGKREIDDVPLVENTPRYNAADAALVDDEDQSDREASETFLLNEEKDAAE